MNYIMNKVKNSFKLIAYQIIHGNEFLDSLEKVFHLMKTKND
mgnify:CR=1 FL=1